MTPYYDENGITIYHGDCFEVVPSLSAVDAIVTDPPYSSGGQYRGDRLRSTTAKYTHSSTVDRYPEFTGDHFDQRTFTIWAEAWLRACRSAASSGAFVASFIDWRQIPALTDAFQFAGWSWRGLAVWDKGFGRPAPGRFSNASEFVVWGSNGTMNTQEGVYQPGVFRASTPRNKEHIAQKPLDVLQWILGVSAPDALILDPFMGSGTTLVAAKDLGRRAIGVEIEERYCEIAVQRLTQGVLEFA